MKRLVTFFLIVIVGVFAFSQGNLSNVLDVSNSLKSFKGLIEIENHANSKITSIMFNFEFVPPSKMRISYLYPRNMKGMLIILNGQDFYNYIPALNMKNHIKVGKKSKNPGESMGFFFHFVQRDLTKFLKNYSITYANETKELELKFQDRKFSYEVQEVTIKNKNFKEEIFYDAKKYVPIEVKIYGGGKLASVVKVLKYNLNISIPSDDFVLK